MIRIALFSDIHAFRPDPQADRFRQGDPSWARTLPDRFERDRGPFQALEQLIRERQLKADYVFSCGDMGDKADIEGIRHSWSWLETFRRRLDASLVIGTTGNHDVDSRNKSGTDDPMHCTRVLQPPFPIDVDGIRDQYWEKHAVLYSEGDLEVLIVNSAAEHANEDLAQRGHLTEETLREIESCVSKAKGKIRVALIHHHPYRHDAIDWTDSSELDGGPELLRILEDNGDWVVVHGHRHYPSLTYASGGLQRPVILASGSFAAMLYPELQARVRNQFHILELEAPGSVPDTSGVIGTVESWEYSPSAGWTAPVSQEGIPDGSGFGFRGNAQDAAKEVAGFVRASPETFVTLRDVIEALPKIRYLTPRDRKQILGALGGYGISVAPSVSNYASSADEIFFKDVGK